MMKISLGRHLLLLAAAGMFFGVAGCGKKNTAGKQNKVVRVSLAQLTEQDFKQRIPVQGTVEPVEFAALSSRTEGTLDILNVDEGDVVKKGQLLFQIDRRNLENEVTVAQRALDVCETEVKTARISFDLAKIRQTKARIDFERAQTLRKSNAVSQDSFETAELAFKEAQAECNRAASLVDIAEALVEKQRNNLSIAQKNLADSEIKAPFDGVITDTFVEQGEFVKGGTEILRLENPAARDVVCFISALHYPNIVPGETRALFRLDDAPAGEAVVTYRAPNVDPLSRTFKIKIRVPQHTALVSGVMCSVDLLTRERHGFGLPADAFQQRDNGQVIVLAEKDGKAEQIVVKPGITDNNMTEILDAEPLKGRKFIVRGQTFVNAGDQLSVLKEL